MTSGEWRDTPAPQTGTVIEIIPDSSPAEIRLAYWSHGLLQWEDVETSDRAPNFTRWRPPARNGDD